MAIDWIGPGFNPHLLSDQSPVNAAISSLVLPSSFRPMPDPKTSTGSRWELDTTLLESAEVTSEDPVHRHLQDPARGAVDGQRPDRRRRLLVPVAADGQPARRGRSRRVRPHHRGAVGRGRQDRGGDVLPAVSGVARVVQQHPARAHRQGRARRIRGGPGAGAPVTGGQFRVENIDPQRDEILLARNDRYWGAPAKPDLVLFRRGGDAAALADSIRNGDTQVAQVHGGAAAFAQLSARSPTCAPRGSSPRASCR